MYNTPIFMDSGAHGLYSEYIIKKQHKEGYAWFETSEFTDYLDKYASFIKEHEEYLELYANVDVIFNPELTWKSQQYLEQEHGLKPIPVIHFNTPLKWLERYLKKGYEYIALGGLGQEARASDYVRWADQAFNIICDQASRMPVCKVHGFAMTAYKLMRRYPWYSVDSTSWILYASYGGIIIPPKENGVWTYNKPFQTVKVTSRTNMSGAPTFSMTMAKGTSLESMVNEYIADKGYVMGESKIENDEEVVITPGLCNQSMQRCELNAEYFLDFRNSLPEWPWAFSPKLTGFNLA